MVAVTGAGTGSTAAGAAGAGGAGAALSSSQAVSLLPPEQAAMLTAGIVSTMETGGLVKPVRLSETVLQRVVEAAEEGYLEVNRSALDIDREDPSDENAVQFW